MINDTQAVLDSNNLAKTAGLITFYNVDCNTYEYIGSSSEYLIVGVGIPALSYLDVPPAAQSGYVVCRNSKGDTWDQVEDHRGDTVYDTSTLAAATIQAIGPLGTNQTLLAPATSYDEWSGTAWITNTITQKAAQVNAAVAEQTALISAANIKTQFWQTQLMLGIINAADKNTLTSWMIYAQAVQAVNTSTAPDITWPSTPQ